MIKYNLICKCGETFESWFSSSSKFDLLSKKNLYQQNVITKYLMLKVLKKVL